MVRRGIQLYSVASLDESLPDVLHRVAGFGYEGVEFGPRFWRADVDATAAALEDTGLAVVGVHASLDRLETDLVAAVERCRSIGCRDVAVPHLPARFFRTPSRVEALGARLNVLGRRLADRGIRLHYHNQVHDFMALGGVSTLGRMLAELAPVDGRQAPEGPFARTRHRVACTVGTLGDHTFERLYQRGIDPVATDLRSTAYGRLAAVTDPGAVGFEPDIGAAAAAGYGVGPLVELIGHRASLLHLKDVDPDRRHPTAGQRSVEPGTGIVPFDRVVEAARRRDIEWLVYEYERGSDPLDVLAAGASALDAAIGAAPARPAADG